MKITFNNKELRIDGLLCYPIANHESYLCRVDGTMWSLKGRKVKQLKIGINKNTGYPIIKLDGKSYNAHYLFCTAFHGIKPSPKHQVAHYDGVKTNNSADNLRWTIQGKSTGFPNEQGFFELTNSMDSVFHYNEKQGNLTGRLSGFINKYSEINESKI